MDTSAEQIQWSRPTEQVGATAHMDHDLDDLGNLFEFGDINLDNIPPVDSAHYDEQLRPAGTHPSTPFDEMSESQAISGTAAQDFGAHGQYAISQNIEQQQQQQQQRRFHTQTPTSHPFGPEAMYQPSVTQHQAPYHVGQHYPYMEMQAYPSNQHIPPTPNSFEMHGGAGRFLQQQMDQQQRAILEQRYQLRKEDAIAFTPMVSPAGTPQFNVQPEFTIPGAYFSPLTSPMLHAQNGQNTPHHQGYYTNPSTAASSNATSPLDPNTDVDMLGDEMSLSESVHAQVKRSNRRKPPTPRSGGPLARVKQSPIQKAVKRKSGTMLSSLVPTKEVESVLDPQRSAGLQMPPNDSSENGSISPEPLSEILMGPPPRPGSSVGQSPALAAQQQEVSKGTPGTAATPKSLLSMRGGQPQLSDEKPSTTGGDQMDFEELQLPAAATADAAPRPTLPQINTHIGSATPTEDTPRGPRKTPKLGAASTPSSARPPSAMASPSIMGSPITISTPGTLLKDKKMDPKGGRANKKRGSMSGSGSTLVSPALRPRISPSIKPLLPEGASLQSPTHALLLASKSNYQNLLEGNHLPGVHYPDSLSTGLTSKRTSHKVAEQGRRNRINEALKEMQSLLPKTATATTLTSSCSSSSSSTKLAKKSSNSDDASLEDIADGGDDDCKESKEEAAVKSNSSKAATVESANEYIRKLQRENAALLQIKHEHEELKRKFASDNNQQHPLPSDADLDLHSAAVASASVSPPPSSESSPSAVTAAIAVESPAKSPANATAAAAATAATATVAAVS